MHYKLIKTNSLQRDIYLPNVEVRELSLKKIVIYYGKGMSYAVNIELITMVILNNFCRQLFITESRMQNSILLFSLTRMRLLPIHIHWQHMLYRKN